MKRKILIEVGLWLFIILYFYLYMKNPLDKEYDSGIISLIIVASVGIISWYFSERTLTDWVYYSWKDIRSRIGYMILLIVFCVVYFIL